MKIDRPFFFFGEEGFFSDGIIDSLRPFAVPALWRLSNE